VGLRALPDHRLLDRLVRGRAWIVLIGGALIGIVAMQVSLLKLNAGIGRDVQRSAVIQRENEALRATNSRLSGGERVQGIAGRMGLTVPAPGSVRFVSPRPGDAARADRALRAARPVASASAVAAPVGSAAAPATGAPVAAAPVPAATPAPATTAPAPATIPATAPAPGQG
jgi:hypothetical protein